MARDPEAPETPLVTGTVDPAHPFFGDDPRARSLNRARIVALPGVAAAGDLLGLTAADLLSAAVVTALVRAEARRLNLNPDAPDLLRAFDGCFVDPATRPAALVVAATVGRRLGALLLMLWRGDAANRAARPEWGEAQWAYWHGVRCVVVGGGLLAGRLGEAALPAAGALLAAAGCPIVVERSPYGDAVALVGLARHAPADTTQMLVFDFGQTAVKRGLATYRDGALVDLALSPSRPAAPLVAAGTPAACWALMRAWIANDWTAHVPPEARPETAIGLCLATHLRDGHPLTPDRRPYGHLGQLAQHLATFMRDDLLAALGPFRSLALLHDGLAAASTRAGQRHTVVLTLGTAVGVGYGPDEVGRPLAASLKVTKSG